MRYVKQSLMPIVVAIGAATVFAQPSSARLHEDNHFRSDIARFDEHAWDLWRGGGWRHTVHDGRLVS
jgi:hypothetical protein